MLADTVDRRAHRRSELTRPCRVQDPRTGRFLHGTTCDVSLGGVLIRLHRRVDLQPGDRLGVGIAFDERQALLLAKDFIDAVVVRALGTPSGETMVALTYPAASGIVPEAPAQAA